MLKNSKILIIGLSYKAGIADLRNSINLKIFNILKKALKVDVHDPFINKEAKIKFKALNKINNNNTYDAILFLSKNSYFENQFKKIKQKNE